jgi:integrase
MVANHSQVGLERGTCKLRSGNQGETRSDDIFNVIPQAVGCRTARCENSFRGKSDEDFGQGFGIDAVLADVLFGRCIPDTKNQRPHTIHLSDFAAQQFEILGTIRVLTPDGLPCPWVFPNTRGNKALDIKTFGKQLSDRQRPLEKRLSNRTAATESLSLPGGKWTAHDLRRTAATIMASLHVSNDVIDECLNHMIQSRVTRIYNRDRRLAEQIKAFDVLGKRLAKLVSLAHNK